MFAATILATQQLLMWLIKVFTIWYRFGCTPMVARDKISGWKLAGWEWILIIDGEKNTSHHHFKILQT